MRTTAPLLLLVSACVTIVVKPETCPAAPAALSPTVAGTVSVGGDYGKPVFHTAESNIALPAADPWRSAVVTAPAYWSGYCTCTLLFCASSPCNTCTCSLPDGGFEKVPSW